MMYAVISINKFGDLYEQGIFSKKETAIDMAFSCWRGLTNKEQKQETVEVREIEDFTYDDYTLIIEFSLLSLQHSLMLLEIEAKRKGYLYLEYGLELYTGFSLIGLDWFPKDDEELVDTNTVYYVKNGDEYYVFNQDCLEFIEKRVVYEKAVSLGE